MATREAHFTGRAGHQEAGGSGVEDMEAQECLLNDLPEEELLE
jgi:hypothetical protein